MKRIKIYAILWLIAFNLTQSTVGQTSLYNGGVPGQQDSTRAVAIIQQINVHNENDRTAMVSIVHNYFQTLQIIAAERKNSIKKAEESTSEKELVTARVQAAWNTASGQLNKTYVSFLGKISGHLSAEQVEELKDLMTEDGLQNEFDRFLLLLPGLKKVHKAQITAYLKEARENAMTAENSEHRSDWFIKYRGRANNYLAAAGFDLRKATEELEARGRVLRQ